MNRPEAAKPSAGKRRAAVSAGSGGRVHANTLAGLYGDGQPPANWRDRLPDPAAYYACHVPGLTAADVEGRAHGPCPFHPDHGAALDVHLAGRGGWRCEAGCGAGDLVSFHMRRRGLGFKAAVRELVWGCGA